MDNEMFVIKRNGKKEAVLFDKILARIKNLGENFNVNYTSLVIKIVDQLYNNIQTSKIDELVAEQCASNASLHLDYNILAGKIMISNHHKETDSNYLNVVEKLYEFYDIHGTHFPMVSLDFCEIVRNNYSWQEAVGRRGWWL